MIVKIFIGFIVGFLIAFIFTLLLVLVVGLTSMIKPPDLWLEEHYKKAKDFDDKCFKLVMWFFIIIPLTSMVVAVLRPDYDKRILDDCVATGQTIAYCNKELKFVNCVKSSGKRPTTKEIIECKNELLNY